MRRFSIAILLWFVASTLPTFGAGGSELEFIDRLTQQRQAVVEMAALVRQVSENEEIKVKAAEFARVATREIARLQYFRTQWYGDRAQPGDEPVPPPVEIAPALATLRQAPNEAFDRTYIEQMLAHDRAGIALARKAERNAQHADMRALATQIITQQHREIERLRRFKTP